jgi:hypothetical protein
VEFSAAAAPSARPTTDTVGYTRFMATAWFTWDSPVDAGTLRERLRHPDRAVRAQWQGLVMREARFTEVFEWLSLDEIVRDMPCIERHLGRRKAFWQWLLDGWRRDGLLSPAA